MTQKRLKISIALLVGFVLFTGLLQFVPISISFGKSHHTNSDLRNMPLQPNGTYLVYVKKPMALPDDMELVTGPWTGPCKGQVTGWTFRGAGFFHMMVNVKMMTRARASAWVISRYYYRMMAA